MVAPPKTTGIRRDAKAVAGNSAGVSPIEVVVVEGPVKVVGGGGVEVAGGDPVDVEGGGGSWDAGLKGEVVAPTAARLVVEVEGGGEAGAGLVTEGETVEAGGTGGGGGEAGAISDEGG